MEALKAKLISPLVHSWKGDGERRPLHSKDCTLTPYKFPFADYPDGGNRNAFLAHRPVKSA